MKQNTCFVVLLLFIICLVQSQSNNITNIDLSVSASLPPGSSLSFLISNTNSNNNVSYNDEDGGIVNVGHENNCNIEISNQSSSSSSGIGLGSSSLGIHSSSVLGSSSVNSSGTSSSLLSSSSSIPISTSIFSPSSSTLLSSSLYSSSIHTSSSLASVSSSSGIGPGSSSVLGSSSLSSSASILPMFPSLIVPGSLSIVGNQLNVWPSPQLAQFTTGSFLLLGTSTPQIIPFNNLINQTWIRYQSLIFNNPSIISTGGISNIYINVINGNIPLHAGVDESYYLMVNQTTIVIQSNTTFGAMHAIETLSQLIQQTSTPNQYIVTQAPLFIYDWPTFGHRGLMIDTARVFISVPNIEILILGMSYNKMNVLHWHMTDDQSFPFNSTTWPLLVNAAFTPTEVYQHSDVLNVVNYAASLGIRVIAEFDVPAHTQSWCDNYNTLICSPCTYNSYGTQYSQLDPAKPETYAFLSDLYTEIFGLFSDDYYHGGGDEVQSSSWTTCSSISNWMSANNLGSFGVAYAYFWTNLSISVTSSHKRLILWEDLYDDAGNLVPQNITLEFWSNIQNAGNAINNGYNVLLAPYDYWYLVEGSTVWTNVYSFSPYNGLTANQTSFVHGGEMTMWGDQNPTFSIGNVWPQAAAGAEQLWNSGIGNNYYLASCRYSIWSQTLVNRAVALTASSSILNYCFSYPSWYLTNNSYPQLLFALPLQQDFTELVHPSSPVGQIVFSGDSNIGSFDPNVQAFDFDGTAGLYLNQTVFIPYNYTIGGWFYDYNVASPYLYTLFGSDINGYGLLSMGLSLSGQFYQRLLVPTQNIQKGSCGTSIDTDLSTATVSTQTINYNTWTHVAASYNPGTNLSSIFVNGTLIASSLIPFTAWLNQPHPFNIGGQYCVSNAITGYAKCMGIWSGNLNSIQLTNLIKRQISSNGDISCLLLSNFATFSNTVSSSSSTGVSISSSAILSSSIVSSSLSLPSSSSSIVSSSLSLSSSSSSAITSVNVPSPLFALPLLTNTLDLVSMQLIPNMSQPVAGQVPFFNPPQSGSFGLQFEDNEIIGRNGLILSPLLYIPTNYTISIWVYNTNFGPNFPFPITYLGTPFTTNKSINIGVTQYGSIYQGIGTPNTDDYPGYCPHISTNIQYYTSQLNTSQLYILPVLQWTHLVYTFSQTSSNSGQGAIYMNGSMVSQGPMSTNGFSTTMDNIYLGGEYCVSSGMIGVLQCLGIWNSSLNAIEIAALYAFQSNITGLLCSSISTFSGIFPLANITNNYNQTSTSSPTLVFALPLQQDFTELVNNRIAGYISQESDIGPFVSNSYQFTGAGNLYFDSSVYIPNIYTISGWFYDESPSSTYLYTYFGSDTNGYGFLTAGVDTSNTFYQRLQIPVYGTQIGQCGTISNSVVGATVSSQSVSYYTWTYFTISYNPITQNSTIYINGTLAATSIISNINWPNAQHPINLGGQYCISNAITGYGKCIGIWQGTLNTTQIQKVMNEQLNGNVISCSNLNNFE